jgi:hypothetical protein
MEMMAGTIQRKDASFMMCSSLWHGRAATEPMSVNVGTRLHHRGQDPARC